MLRSCIGKVFAVVLATPQTAQKIAYMRGSDSDDIEPQKNAITHQIAPKKTRAIRPIKLLP